MYKRPALRAQLDDHKPASDASGLECRDPTLTQQNFMDDCDINTILERFMRTGEVPTVVQLPQYGDFTAVSDYQSAMNAIRNAQDEFMKMPAKMRARFDNDPQQFLDFCTREENRDELERMGLLKPAQKEPKDAPEPPKDTRKAKGEPSPKTPPKNTDED